MHTSLRRSLGLGLLSSALLACSDQTEVQSTDASSTPRSAAAAPAAKGLGAVHPGMRPDSLALVLGTGPITATLPADTIRARFGHRARLVVAPNHLYWMLLYRDGDVNVDTPVDVEKDTPILFDPMGVVLVGWAEYRKQSEALKLPDWSAFLLQVPKS